MRWIVEYPTTPNSSFSQPFAEFRRQTINYIASNDKANSSVLWSWNATAAAMRASPLDHSPILNRHEVLCHTSTPLEQDLKFIVAVALITGWEIKLCDVHPKK
ncbi:MAG: hypothetical protein VCB07_09690 [Gammaproteobacteria bacterium]